LTFIYNENLFVEFLRQSRRPVPTFFIVAIIRSIRKLFLVQSSPEVETSSSKGLKRRKLEGGGGRTSSSLAMAATGRHKAAATAAFRTNEKKGQDEMDSQSFSSSDDESGADDGGKVMPLFNAYILFSVVLTMKVCFQYRSCTVIK
jgi:hypothetical protein